MTPERRFVAIVFARIHGLVAGQEDEVLTRFRGAIESRGGTVDKFVGDVVMAVFGAPVARGDDVARAVAAAAAMALEASRDGLTLAAGINAGEVLWGSVGGDRPTAIGDAVNVAARLMSEAGAGRILASEDVIALAPRARFGEPLELALKGRAETVGARALEEELDDVPGDDLPLRGRAAELKRLRALVAECEAVVLEGDEGVGKSRLAREFGRTPSRPGMRFAIARAPDLVPLPMAALAELGREASGEPGAREFAASVAADLERTGMDAEAARDAGALAATVLGLPVAESPAAFLPPAQVVAETRRAWTRWLLALAPAVLVLDDAHVADEASLEVLRDVARAPSPRGVAVVLAARPGAAIPEGFQKFALRPLPRRAALEVAEDVFRAPLTHGLARFILDASGGNPEYMEELSRHLRDAKLLEGNPLRLARAADVPRSLQALLTARLDTLPAQARESLKAASVLGGEFWLGLARALGAKDEGVEEARRRGLVRRQGRSALPGEEEFQFHPKALAGAAYALVTKKERSRLHERAAEILGETPSRRTRAMAASHRERCGQTERAIDLLSWASGDANHARAFEEQLAFAREIGRLGATATAALGTGSALAGLGRLREIAAAIAPALDPSAGADDRAEAHQLQSFALLRLGDPAGSLEAADAAVAVAPAYAPSRSAMRRVEALMRLGRPHEALLAARTQIAATADPRYRADLVQTSGLVLLELSQHAEALVAFQQALHFYQTADRKLDRARCLGNIGIIQYQQNDIDGAERAFHQARELFESLRARQYLADCEINLGNVLYTRGLFRESIVRYERARSLARALSNPTLAGRALGNIGHSLAELGDLAGARRAMAESAAGRGGAGDRVGEAWSSLFETGISSRMTGAAAALEAGKRSLAVFREAGHVDGVYNALQTVAQCHWSLGELARAEESLSEAVAVASGIGNAIWAWRSRLELCRIAAWRGRSSVLPEEPQNPGVLDRAHHHLRLADLAWMRGDRDACERAAAEAAAAAPQAALIVAEALIFHARACPASRNADAAEAARLARKCGHDPLARQAEALLPGATLPSFPAGFPVPEKIAILLDLAAMSADASRTALDAAREAGAEYAVAALSPKR